MSALNTLPNNLLSLTRNLLRFAVNAPRNSEPARKPAAPASLRACRLPRLRRASLTAGLFALALPAASAVHAQQLIQNGNFETGDFTGFTVLNETNPADTNNADHFYISTSGSATPAVDGFSFATAANPTGGRFYAVTASDNPGVHAITQNFVVPTGTTDVRLSFQMFVNDQSGSGGAFNALGNRLDYTSFGTYADNQNARVDIMRANTDPFSIKSSDIMATFYGPKVDSIAFDSSGNLIPNPFKTYSFDLFSLLMPGQEYRLRFAEVDNLSALNMGVDNISLVAVPEPGSVALLVGLGVTGAGFLARRRRR